MVQVCVHAVHYLKTRRVFYSLEYVEVQCLVNQQVNPRQICKLTREGPSLGGASPDKEGPLGSGVIEEDMPTLYNG